jgi:hypothetical protein
VRLRTLAGLCDDTFTFPGRVKVYPSELEVPNVFSPLGDGDIYSVRAVSLREFRAMIFSRDGRKVFEWTETTGGWDGRIGGNMASPGVYYYIITGTGWDGRKFDLNGPLHLFRGKQ